MTETQQVRVGIIGLGGVGNRVMNAFLKHNDVKIVALCDTVAERVADVAERLGNVAQYTDYKQAVLDPNVDLFYVAVPPKFHHSIALAVMRAGKHILCEKPLANSIAEAKEMFQVATETGVVNGINFPTHYHGAFHALREKLAEGFLGNLRRVEIKTHFSEWPRSWQKNEWIAGREQGGFVREVAPHFLQLTESLLGDIVNVNTFIEYPEAPELCETGIVARMSLRDGTPILLDGLSRLAKSDEVRFTLYGDQGTLTLLNWNILLKAGVGEALSEVELPADNSLWNLVNELVRAVRGESADLVSFEEGYKIQQVLDSLLDK